MSAPLLAKLFTDEQLVLADGEHPEEEDGEVRASRLAMPLLQWLADQHHRKHHANVHVPGTTAVSAVSSSVPAYGGDAGAVSRLVASALVRDWSALSLPALAALVRVLTTECACFLPAHAAEEVARRTVDVARRHVGSGGGGNGRGGLLVDILECLLRLAEQNGAPLLIHSVRAFFALLVDEGGHGPCAVGRAFECVRMGLRASPVLRQMTSQLFSEHLLPTDGGAASGQAVSDVFLLLAMGCTQERTGEANRMLGRLLLLLSRTGPTAAAPMVERVVEAAVRGGGGSSSDELVGLLRGLALHLVNGDSWRPPATTTKGEPALQWSDSLSVGDEDEDEDDGGDEGDVDHDHDDHDDATQAGTDQAETQIELGKLLLITMFGRHEASRGAVFEAVLGRATDTSQTRDAQAACTSVLATLALRHPQALLALLTRTMPHWPEYCAQLPNDVSHRILGAFLPLGRHDAAFSHHLLKFIMAAMLPGEQNDNAASSSRRFAVHGLCTLLSSSSSSSSPSSASAAVASLACITVDGGCGDDDERRPSLVEHALGLPLDSRKPFYDSLHAMFLDYAHPRGDDGDKGDDDDDNNTTEAAEKAAMGRVMLSGGLHGLLLERAGRHFYYAEPPGPRVALLSCFEPTPDPPTARPSATTSADSAAATASVPSESTSTSAGFSLHVRLRELLPELLRCLACCASLQPDHDHPNYQRTRELFGALVAQMVDTSAGATSAYAALAGVPAPSAGADQLTDHTSPGARRRASSLPPTIWAARASANTGGGGGGARRVQLRSLNGAGELALCPPSLISLRQRMVVLAPLYEAIIDCVLRCPQLFALGPGGADRKAVELLEVRSTLLSLTRTAVKKNRRTHYATILHTDGHRPRTGKPLLSMEGLLRLLDLHRASACVLSTEAVKDLLALIGRHVALRKSSASLDPRESWDAGALFSRLFGFYHSTLTDRNARPTPSTSSSSSGLARSLERKGRDDVLRLRKALVRLMGAMLPHKPARHPASAASTAEAGHDHGHDEAVFAASVHRAIHAAVQLLLPRIIRTTHDAAPDDAGVDRQQQQRKRPRTADDADGSAETCAAVTPTEACAALAYFFAGQARREAEAGAEKVVPEYVRAVAALSALALEPLAGDWRPVLECAERHEWDRRRRRCVPWLARAVRAVWAMVVAGRRWTGGAGGGCGGDAAWAVGRTMVRHVLAYGFLLPLDDRRRFAHDLFAACSDALEARKERPRAGPEEWSAGVQQPQPLEQQQRERGFGEAGLLELLAHHRHQATQALALLRARRHLLPPSGVLGALRLVTASQGEFVRCIEWLPSEVLQRFLALTSKVCKVCAELAGQLYRVELARAENAKNAVKKHTRSPFFHPDHKPSSSSSSSSSSASSASFLKRRVGYYDYGIARPKADDGGDPEAQRPQLEWTPAAREEVERMLAECAALMRQTRRWVVGDHHEGFVAGTGAGVSGALGSFASAVDLYCGALRRLARLPAWRESPTGKELAVGLAELEEKEADEDEDEAEGDGEERKKKRRRKKRAPRLAVMRSTNSYIDAELRRAGGGNDSYADLEDFIECPKGPILWD